jgi:demethylmenaquinone methyltransferase / 2-methoxy-6-polyprenyl-1,4-benzoquinol methylase
MTKGESNKEGAEPEATGGSGYDPLSALGVPDSAGNPVPDAGRAGNAAPATAPATASATATASVPAAASVPTAASAPAAAAAAGAGPWTAGTGQPAEDASGARDGPWTAGSVGSSPHRLGGSQSTHFGYQTVEEGEKASRVRKVFDSVAGRYDLMNDLMSGGWHRLWKRFTVGQAALRPGMRVLDLATGSGDLARAMARRNGVEVWMTDINASMLSIGRDRAIDDGLSLPVIQCDAERLPFPDGSFDRVTVAFGLRNMTHKDLALAEMVRVLKPGGRALVLEFSRVWKPLTLPYNAFSFAVLPALGKLIARDAQSYRYLAESIRVHPDQESLSGMMEAAGFARVQYFNLAAGVVALHQGVKI